MSSISAVNGEMYGRAKPKPRISHSHKVRAYSCSAMSVCKPGRQTAKHGDKNDVQTSSIYEKKKKKPKRKFHHKPIDPFWTVLDVFKSVNVPWKQSGVHNTAECSSCGLAPGHFMRKWVWGWCDMWMLWNARWMEGSFIRILIDGCGMQQQGSPKVTHHILSFNTTSFTQLDQWPSRHLICDCLQHFWCRCVGQCEERKGMRLMFAPFNSSSLSEALVLVLAVLSPGTAVAPGCWQFRGWAVCVVTVCHLCLCWQVGFGIHCETFLPLPGYMFHTLKRPASAERSV